MVYFFDSHHTFGAAWGAVAGWMSSAVRDWRSFSGPQPLLVLSRWTGYAGEVRNLSEVWQTTDQTKQNKAKHRGQTQP